MIRLLLDELLRLENCPHCGVDTPNLSAVVKEFETRNSRREQVSQRNWRIYSCSRCGGVVTAGRPGHSQYIDRIYPVPKTIPDEIPERVRRYLFQAHACLNAPSGAVMCAASALDSMLKDKGYKTGTLNERIKKAAQDHLITVDMASWAHHIRLGANEERHPDDEAEIPTTEEAQAILDFADALGEFLFVLPSRVAAGIARSDKNRPPKSNE